MSELYQQLPDNSNGIYEFKNYTITVLQDNMIRIEFKEGFSGTLADAKHQVEIFKKIKGTEKCLLLVILKHDNVFSKETREYMAGNAVSEVIKADALVVKGLALKIFTNGYLRINKPTRPTRLFNNEAEAISWLQRVT